jgi:hypothetical protein
MIFGYGRAGEGFEDKLFRGWQHTPSFEEATPEFLAA